MPLKTDCTCNSRFLTFCGRTLFRHKALRQWVNFCFRVNFVWDMTVWQYMHWHSNAHWWFWIDLIPLLSLLSRVSSAWKVRLHLPRFQDAGVFTNRHGYKSAVETTHIVGLCTELYTKETARTDFKVCRYHCTYGLHRSYLSRWGDNKSIFCSAIEDVTISHAWLKCTKLCIPGSGNFCLKME